MSSRLPGETPPAAAEILSITQCFVPRSQTWLYDEVAHLRRHRVHVVTQRPQYLDEYPHSPLTLLPSERTFGALAERLGHRLLAMQPPVFCRASRRRLAELLDSGSFRLVQAHFGWVARAVAAEVARRGLPLVAWIYGADVFHRKEAALMPRLFSAGGDRWYCCTSHALRRALEELGCPADRIRVFHPGVAVAPEPPARERSDAVRILSAGRLVKFKDPLSLAEVARALRDRGCRFTWQHLGNGPLRGAMEKAVARHGLADSFVIRGTVPHDEVLARMREADMLVHAAVVQPDGRRESFGVVLAEAAAAGLPIVSAAIGGIPEIVRDGETGFLVGERDCEGLAAKAELLAGDPELRERLGRAAHRHALESFELSRQVEKLDSFYDEVLGR